LNPTPGPGTYQTIQPVNKKCKYINKHNESYDFIQEILKNTHETTVSIPNYEI
jgi:hypothetical protein